MKPCEFCGRDYVPVRYNAHRQKYCNKDCAYNARDERKNQRFDAVTRQVGPQPGLRAIQILRAQSPRGVCVYCRKATKLARSTCCFSKECRPKYMADYRRSCGNVEVQ